MDRKGSARGVGAPGPVLESTIQVVAIALKESVALKIRHGDLSPLWPTEEGTARTPLVMGERGSPQSTPEEITPTEKKEERIQGKGKTKTHPFLINLWQALTQNKNTIGPQKLNKQGEFPPSE